MKRLCSFWVVFYVLVTEGGHMSKATYEGMSQTTIQTLLAERTGATFRFVDKATFDAAPDAPRESIDPARIAAKSQARLDVKNAQLTKDQRFQALLTVLDLDR